MAESARTPPFSSLRNLNRLEQLRQSFVEILDTLNAKPGFDLLVHRVEGRRDLFQQMAPFRRQRMTEPTCIAPRLWTSSS